LFKSLIIKQIVAAAMLVVFAFSITPTIVFHNWLAGHTDTLKRSTHTQGEHIGKQTFNCHCDNIVAESPFTEPGKTIIAHTEQVFSSVNTEKHILLISSPHHFFLLRGPPAV
jgi:hypothetical protein